jgi:hypothetical protein
MKPKTYKLIDRCVEDGVARGYRQAYKHTDDPSDEAVCERIAQEVMNQLDQWFDFGDEVK